MSNIDKRALRKKLNRRLNDAFGFQRTSGGKHTTISLSIDECKSVIVALDELEADKEQIKTLESRNSRLEGIIDAAEKRIAETSGQKRLIGWRASDYTDETSDPELAKYWAAAIGVLPIFEGDVNTKLSAAGIGKGE
ncbi:hypothetical protein [Citrobacter sedlakii]|uniref:hypothetical protein n=1 Tax=Citrobacter sedlakii TaxID=67826 RepID=UPI003890666D